MSRSAIITIITAILLIIFAVQNSEPASMTLLFWDLTMSLALLLLIMFVLGTGFGYFFHMTISMRKKKTS
ncbi:MAG: DUF1049 domain-containing protein [Bacteroidales bacterium]|nr:DUF1049 domain-containing protein [Bacteroidales bacterium]